MYVDNSDSLELLGKALAATFQKFAAQAPSAEGRKVYFQSASRISSHVTSHRDIGTLIVEDAKLGTKTFISAYLDDSSIGSIGFTSSVDNSSVENSPLNAWPLHDNLSTANLVRVAEFMGEHFNCSASGFLKELNEQIQEQKPPLRELAQRALQSAGLRNQP